ncbi:MAG: glycosyltransferase family 2 protein [Bacteroidia bacterium]|nr:glycosyltransferase [Bacteroidia bacterium]MDW8014724.1 glycosyltransferase family 2 protein [Bacteroidia bacterium]
MDKPPTLSIITVTYQAAQVLPLTLRSTAEQTWRDWEHVFVDGGSTDETMSLIRSYREEAPSLSYISEPDRGIYDAMNKGLRLARGTYVVFLNAGDSFWRETTLEEIFSCAPPEAEVIYGDHRYVNGKLEILKRRRPRPYPKGTLQIKHFRTGMAVAHQALFVRRSIAPFYDLSYPLAADLDWAIRLMKNNPSCYDTGKTLIRYLEGGVSARRRYRYIWERTQIIYKHFGWKGVIESGAAVLLNLWQRGYPGVE